MQSSSANRRPAPPFGSTIIQPVRRKRVRCGGRAEGIPGGLMTLFVSL